MKYNTWAPCEGADGRVKANGSRVQEVTEEGSRRRRFLVHSPERERHERKLREAEQDKVRERLERLRERVALGEFGKRAQREVQAEREQAAGLIGEAAGKILSQNHGQRYYDWRREGEERLEYWENESCAQEKRREGHWLLETEETELGAVEAVRAYQELWRVEAAFRSMKDVLELRPIWHRTDERVQAHVLVAALALTFDRILQRKLEKAGLRLSSRAAWEALEAVSLVEFEMPGRPRKAGICVTGEEGGHGNEARKVLRALGVALEAPQPPQNGDRIVH